MYTLFVPRQCTGSIHKPYSSPTYFNQLLPQRPADLKFSSFRENRPIYTCQVLTSSKTRHVVPRHALTRKTSSYWSNRRIHISPRSLITAQRMGKTPYSLCHKCCRWFVLYYYYRSTRTLLVNWVVQSGFTYYRRASAKQVSYLREIGA